MSKTISERTVAECLQFDKALEEIYKHFTPEILNRFDSAEDWKKFADANSNTREYRVATLVCVKYNELDKELSEKEMLTRDEAYGYTKRAITRERYRSYACNAIEQTLWLKVMVEHLRT